MAELFTRKRLHVPAYMELVKPLTHPVTEEASASEQLFVTEPSSQGIGTGLLTHLGCDGEFATRTAFADCSWPCSEKGPFMRVAGLSA